MSIKQDVERDLLDIKLRKSLERQCMFTSETIMLIMRYKNTIYIELKKHFIEVDKIIDEA